MTNETTPSQPKSIGDDAQFRKALAAYGSAMYNGVQVDGVRSDLIAAIDNFRAPAAQASATIQAAPSEAIARYNVLEEAARYLDDVHSIALGNEIRWLKTKPAATIQEPVMVAEPVGEGQAQTSAAFPLMRAAFETSESGPDGYFIKFKFPTLVAMQKAHIEWIAAQLTDSTLAAPMVADPAGVATVYEWRHRHAEHMPWGEWKLCDKDQYDLVVERTRQNLSLQSSTKLDEVRATLAATVKAVPSEALGASPWTLTEDRLPPVETPVLILHSGDVKIGEIRWENPSHEETFEAFMYWDDPNDDGQSWDWLEVTHWMPIPAAPLADKTGGGE